MCQRKVAKRKSMRAQTIFFSVMAGALLPMCSLAAPQPIRGGSITDVEVVDGEVEWVDLDTVLQKERIEPRESIPEEALEFRTPDDGSEFVVLTVELGAGYSIGRMDYRLRFDGRSYKCLAMAVDDAPFDPRRLEVIAESAAKTVRLLYEVREGVEKASLQFTLATRLSVPDVALTIREPAPEAAEPEEAEEAEEEPEGEDGEDEDAPPADGEEEQDEPPESEDDDADNDEEPEPEPEPEPEEEAEPEEEPEPEEEEDEEDEEDDAWEGLL